jgi:hypothetical protein
LTSSEGRAKESLEESFKKSEMKVKELEGRVMDLEKRYWPKSNWAQLISVES